MPELDKDKIKDEAKLDIFTKAVAILQFLQLLISILIRVARRLAFSQLELVTLAFAIYGFLIYILY